MEEMFENKVLDDLYEIRRDGFECIFIKHYGEPQEIQKSRTSENQLTEKVEKFVKNKKKKKQILGKLQEYKDDLLGEMCFWEQQYYKLGFVDGIYFKKEAKEQKQNFSNNVNIDNMEENSFFYIWKHSLIEFLGKEIRKKSKKYSEITNKMGNIKEQFENVRVFLEDRKNSKTYK